MCHHVLLQKQLSEYTSVSSSLSKRRCRSFSNKTNTIKKYFVKTASQNEEVSPRSTLKVAFRAEQKNIIFVSEEIGQVTDDTSNKLLLALFFL